MGRLTSRPGPALRTVGSMVRDLNRLQLKVGFIDGKHYPAKDGKAGPSVAYIASIHENGYLAKGIPPRSFFRITIADRQMEWNRLYSKGIAKASRGEVTVHYVLDKIGLLAAGDVKKTIAKGIPPPLKEATVKARLRRYSKPLKQGEEIPKSLRMQLNDSGYMISSLLHNVENKK